MSSTQKICNDITTVCGLPDVVLDSTGAIPIYLLREVYKYIYLEEAPESTAYELLGFCMQQDGRTLHEEFYSGKNVTDKGLEQLLYCVKDEKVRYESLSGKDGKVYARGRTYRSQQKEWVSMSRSTADSLKEFIDNSYTAYHNRKQTNQTKFPTVDITINYETREIIVLDDSGGMDAVELGEALLLGDVNSAPTLSGMSGFGVGLKQAATWFVGVNNVWTVESSKQGEPDVLIRTLEKTPAKAIAPIFTANTRKRNSKNADPLIVGFTRIILKFGEDMLMKNKISPDSTADQTTHEGAVRLELAYTYARFLENAKKMMPPTTEGESPTMKKLPTKLAIRWTTISENGAKTLIDLRLPADCVAGGKTNNEVERLPDDLAAVADIRHGYIETYDNIQYKYWWTCLQVDALLSGLGKKRDSTSKDRDVVPVVVNIRVANNMTLDRVAESGGVNAIKLTYRKYSRGTRIYYNDRLVCVKDAPYIHNWAVGSTGAKSILIEVDVEHVEMALQAMGLDQRLLSSSKNSISEQGSCNTIMSQVEDEAVKWMANECLLVDPSDTNYEGVTLRTIANESLSKRGTSAPIGASGRTTSIGLYATELTKITGAGPTIPAKTVTKTKTSNTPTENSSTNNNSNTTASPWSRQYTDKHGVVLDVSVTNTGNAYTFTVTVKAQGTTWTSRPPVTETSADKAYEKFAATLFWANVDKSLPANLSAHAKLIVQEAPHIT